MASPEKSISASEANESDRLLPLKFNAGDDSDRLMLAGVAEASMAAAANFNIAHARLCGEASDETIVMATSAEYCGSGGCETLVLRASLNGYSVLLNQNLPDLLAVSPEKIDGCFALEAIDENGKVVIDDRPGTPLFGKPMIYPIREGGNTL